MIVEYLDVDAVSNRVVALVDDEQVDVRHPEEVVIQRVQEDLMNHHQNLKKQNKKQAKQKVDHIKNLKNNRPIVV
jgi:TfoX/Sxy family transcriptional regulator of competence genes